MRITNKDMSILIGLLLGDGYISEKGRIEVEHCEKQKEYCTFKAKLLHSVCGGKDIKVHKLERTHSVRKDGKQYKSNTFITYKFRKQSKSFIPIRELLYRNGKKEITKELLEFIDLETLVLWWLDDGCVSKKYTYKEGKRIECGHMLRIFTYLPFEQNLLLREFFLNKYGITWNVVKADGGNEDQFMLRCGTTEGRKFLNLIRQYVLEKIPSMSYKVIDI